MKTVIYLDELLLTNFLAAAALLLGAGLLCGAAYGRASAAGRALHEVLFSCAAPFDHTFRCLRMENILPRPPTTAPPMRLYGMIVDQTALTGTSA